MFLLHYFAFKPPVLFLWWLKPGFRVNSVDSTTSKEAVYTINYLQPLSHIMQIHYNFFVYLFVGRGVAKKDKIKPKGQIQTTGK